MRILTIFSAVLLITACKKDEPIEPAPTPCVPDNYLYYSDYFVFVADDGGSPLVIPLDINWTPTSSGYNSEFKGWYGTTEDWPIGYYLNDTVVDLCTIPQESWEHANGPYFQFNAASREVIATIWEAPELRLTIPEASNWVLTPATDDKEIYGCKTTAKVNGETRSGWLIYERIRRAASAGNFGDFEAFFWIPVVVDGVFYHFEQHRDEQAASRWEESEGDVSVTTLTGFDLTILETSTDEVSGRSNIPEKVQVLASDWDLNLILVSGGSQVGHGPEFPNGLAYYRQSLLTSSMESEDNGYGMLELILEDD